jgi:Coenzyme PQQ synthesis protein D (PqqD)
MVELTLNDRVAIPDSVIAREVEGETVLLNLDTGVYFGLDAVGTAIWRAIQDDGRLVHAVAAVERDYDVDPAVAREDLLRLIAEMIAKGLLQNA